MNGTTRTNICLTALILFNFLTMVNNAIFKDNIKNLENRINKLEELTNVQNN